MGAALARRVQLGAQLFRTGLARRVVMSGGRRWDEVAEADAMLACWRELGLPAGVVLLERRSLTTRGNARCSAELLRSRGMTRVGLVTCDYHLPRAVRHFAAEGLLVRGYGVSVNRPKTSRLWLWARERGARLLERVPQRRGHHWIETTDSHAAVAEPPASP